jgi:hypothetical protein
MLEQSSAGRTYTRDAYAPERRDAHAKAEKLMAGSIPAPSIFYFEESVLDRSAGGCSVFALRAVDTRTTKTIQPAQLPQ